MRALQKAFLALAVAGVVIGILVGLSRARLNPLWTLALPLGFVFAGLFLIDTMLHDALASFDAEERIKTESAKRRREAGSAPSKQGGQPNSFDAAAARSG